MFLAAHAPTARRSRPPKDQGRPSTAGDIIAPTPPGQDLITAFERERGFNTTINLTVEARHVIEPTDTTDEPNVTEAPEVTEAPATT